MKNISKDNIIFKSKKYLEDIVPFSLLEIIKLNPVLLVSDEKNYIIGASSLDRPIWIWTINNIDKNIIKEINEFLFNKLSSNKNITIVAKIEVVDTIVQPFEDSSYSIENRLKMQSFENTKLKVARNQDVVIDRVSLDDINDIADAIGKFYKECENIELDKQVCLQKAREDIKNPLFSVIRDANKVVATAKTSRETDMHIAINQVYTYPEYRGKGYAAALVAYISKLIMDKGKIPTLYTDIENPSSNKAYINVGFVEKGRVDEVKLIKM